MIRRTFVCRPTIDAKGQPSCSGGGFWSEWSYAHNPIHHCGKRMTELAPTYMPFLPASTRGEGHTDA